MISGPSTFSLAASCLYGIVMLACLAAAATALRQRQVSGHLRTWLMLALFFGVLITLRLVNAEEWLRAILRDYLRISGHYGDRRSLQAPLVAAILTIAGAGAMFALQRWARNLRGRRNVARLTGVLAAAAMVCLMALRIASLHLTDALLYGPPKLNWVIDIGVSFVVLVAAIYYVQLVRARP
ncbi:preprotein translocase subunit SecG [Porphyrobacter sp. MBR-155]|jgi:preprotein translocase subunit SecG|uniref:hypothetical protein n=1 Tax=Porphyrobacter sp. MBR-155 TaxID=3156464 RepID=UPI003390CBA7